MINRFLFILPFVVLSCSSKLGFDKNDLARVGDKVLTKEAISGIIPDGTSAEDSITMVKEFVNRWALRELLFHSAENNLTDDQKAEFDDLVERYRNDLYTQAYIRELVNQKTDTTVQVDALEQFYKENSGHFKADQRFYKLKFAKLTPKAATQKQLKSQFFSSKSKDAIAVNEESLKFAALSLNDSIWLSRQTLTNSLPIDKLESQLYPGKQIEFKDSVYVYWIKVKEVVPSGTILPFDLAKDEVKNWIHSQQKNKLIQQLEKDIIKNAIKEKEYEIFN